MNFSWDPQINKKEGYKMVEGSAALAYSQSEGMASEFGLSTKLPPVSRCCFTLENDSRYVFPDTFYIGLAISSPIEKMLQKVYFDVIHETTHHIHAIVNPILRDKPSWQPNGEGRIPTRAGFMKELVAQFATHKFSVDLRRELDYLEYARRVFGEFNVGSELFYAHPNILLEMVRQPETNEWYAPWLNKMETKWKARFGE